MTTVLAATFATLVFWIPGYPGGAGDAQPLVDQFARADAAAFGWPSGSLVAVYDPTGEGGLAKLGQADADGLRSAAIAHGSVVANLSKEQ
jgi:hypothetical protein